MRRTTTTLRYCTSLTIQFRCMVITFGNRCTAYMVMQAYVDCEMVVPAQYIHCGIATYCSFAFTSHPSWPVLQMVGPTSRYHCIRRDVSVPRTASLVRVYPGPERLGAVQRTSCAPPTH